MLVPPLPVNEEQRLAALRRNSILDTPPEAAFDRLTGLAARLFGVPVALVTLVDRDRQWFKSCQGPGSHILGVRETPRDSAFCAYTILSQEPLVVENALLDPRFADNPLVTGDLGLRFYAGAPLVGAEGQVLGALCLLDFQPRAFTAEQCAVLVDLAASVVSEMELRRTTAVLADSERLYRQMFFSSPQPMWIFDIQTQRHLEVNDVACAHYGYSRAEFLEMTIADIHLKEDLPLFQASRPGFGLQPGEKRLWRHRKKNGALIWVEIAAHTIDYEGRTARMVIASDVTERRQAEEEVHRSLAMMKSQQEAVLDGILVVNENRKILSYNQHLCELWTIPDEIIRSKDDDRLLGYVLSQVRQPDEFLQRVQYLYEHPTERSREEIKIADGRVFDRYSGPILSEEGTCYGRIWAFRDITGRKVAEEALRQSEQKMSLHVQQTPMACIEWSPDAEVMAWNLAAEQIFGYSQEEVLGRRMLPLLVPEHVQPHVEAISKALRTQKGGTRSTNENRTKDGRTILCEWYNTPLVNENGEVIGVAALAQDVTEKVHAEAALRDSERRFREIAETIQEMFWVSSPDWSFIEYVSPAYERLWGRSCAELYARPESFTEAIHPEDRPRVLERRRQGYPLDQEYRIVHPGGEVRWMRTRIFPVRSPRGVTLRLIGISEDVTERRQAEVQLQESQQRYKSLVDYHPHTVCSIDTQGRFLEVNAAFEDLTGYSAAEVCGNPFTPLVAPEWRERSRWHYEQTLQGHPQTHEMAILHKDKRQVEVRLTTVPIVVEGVVTGLYAVVEDITQSKQIAEALRQSQKQFSLFMDHLPDMAFIKDLDHRYVYVNETFSRTFDRPSGEWLGKTDEQLWPQEVAALFTANDNQVSETRSPLTTIDFVPHEEGVRQWQTKKFPILNQAGIPILTGGLVTDLTERLVLESEREALLAQTESLLADALTRADYDPLTGLINHRAFHKLLEGELEVSQRTGRPLALLLVDLDNFKFFNDAYGHTVGDEVLQQVSGILQTACRRGDTLARFGGDEFALLMPETSREEAAQVAESLRAAMTRVGYRPPGYDTSIPLTISIGASCFPQDGAGRMALLEAADAHLRVARSGGDDEGPTMVLRRTMTRSIGGFSMLDALVTAVDNKDRYTRRHSEDVMLHSVRLAQALGLDAKTQHVVEVAALLHDVGKIGVPDGILRKPGRLTEEDFAAVQQHPLMGAIIVGAVPGFEEALDAVRHHHERWDGEGYPFGLRGEETPLLARLMAVADAYSAMTMDRPYRKGMDPDRARRILQEGAGTQWDPACVAAFLRAES